MKNYKTTIAGIIGAIIVAAETLMPYFEGEGEVNWYQLAGALVIAIGGYLVKDHDKDNNEDVDVYAKRSIPGGGLKKKP